MLETRKNLDEFALFLYKIILVNLLSFFGSHYQVLAPRIGYLPLLIPLIKPYFKDSLPPGEDSIWFDYKGFPLKWYAIVSSLCIIGI